MKNYKFWFCTGSQDLYGDECLRKVAEHSAKIVEGLNESGNLPFEVVLKPTLISQASIRKTFNDANNDPELLRLREQAKDLCFEFNRLRPSDIQMQEAVLHRLLGKTGESFRILAPFWCDYGSNIEIGENFFANHNTVILDGAKVTFGSNVFIAPNCGFYTAGHPIDFERRNPGLEYAYSITVGDNVWFGAGVQVMPGVTIGSNVVIGGGSVVVHDIPSDSVAVGNPCKVIRAITEEDRKTNWDRSL